MLVDKEGLWYRVLKARYGEEEGRLKEADRHVSLWWRTLCNIRGGTCMGVGSWFDDNTCRVVGDGRNTYFRTDDWVGGVSLRDKFSRQFDLSMHRERSVAELGWGVGGVRGCG